MTVTAPRLTRLVSLRGLIRKFLIPAVFTEVILTGTALPMPDSYDTLPVRSVKPENDRPSHVISLSQIIGAFCTSVPLLGHTIQ